MKQYLIAPSILSADFARLGEGYREGAGGGCGCRALRRYGQPLRAKPDDWPDGAEVTA